VAEDAVRCEPVWSAKFPASREFSRETSKNASLERFLRPEYEHDQRVGAKFLARKEQGILALEQGILSSEQGLSNRGAGYCGQQIKPCAEAGRSRTLDPVKKCLGVDKYFLHLSGKSCQKPHIQEPRPGP
jgi:hypothetical protein